MWPGCRWPAPRQMDVDAHRAHIGQCRRAFPPRSFANRSRRRKAQTYAKEPKSLERRVDRLTRGGSPRTYVDAGIDPHDAVRWYAEERDHIIPCGVANRDDEIGASDNGARSMRLCLRTLPRRRAPEVVLGKLRGYQIVTCHNFRAGRRVRGTGGWRVDRKGARQRRRSALQRATVRAFDAKPIGRSLLPVGATDRDPPR